MFCFQLQQQGRVNTSGATFPNELRDLLRRRLSDLENQLLTKVAELEEEKAQLYNETAAHRQRTENTLNSLLERIAELERSKAPPLINCPLCRLNTHPLCVLTAGPRSGNEIGLPIAVELIVSQA